MACGNRLRRMWDALWINANLATMTAGADDAYGRIEDAAIAVTGGRIAHICAMSELSHEPATLANSVHELHRPMQSSDRLEAAVSAIREAVPFYDRDRPMAPDIAAVKAMIGAGKFVAHAVALF